MRSTKESQTWKNGYKTTTSADRTACKFLLPDKIQAAPFSQLEIHTWLESTYSLGLPDFHFPNG